MSLFCPKYRVVVRTFVQWIMAEYRIKRQHAILQRMFKNVGNKNVTFAGKTVLLLTHDFEPITDFIVVGKLDESKAVASFICNVEGNVIEKDINPKDDVKLILRECKEISTDEDVNVVSRIAFLRKLCELNECRDAWEYAYEILSCLVHARPIKRKNASKVEIKNAIREHNVELKKFKEQLTNMVPYRALAGFFSHSKEKADWNSIRRMRTYIREINDNVTPLPYILGESSKLNKEVRFHSDWIKMIQDNTVNILGWIQYEKVKWLQNNNSEVPGLIYKLAPMNEKMRKLSNVRKLWEGILEIQGIRDVFTGKEMFQSSMM